MVAVYKANPSEAPHVATQSMSMIVIVWPNALDHRDVGRDTEVRGAIDVPAENEPTWEDAAWM